MFVMTMPNLAGLYGVSSKTILVVKSPSCNIHAQSQFEDKNKKSEHNISDHDSVTIQRRENGDNLSFFFFSSTHMQWSH